MGPHEVTTAQLDAASLFSPSRRDFLHVGVIGGLGLTLDRFLRLRAANAERKDYKSREGVCKSIINVFLPGGLAHQDSYDPKPYAPLEYRGELGTVETKIPGERFSETMK